MTTHLEPVKIVRNSLGRVFLVTPAHEQRFWSWVNKNGPISEHRPDLGPCWIWTHTHSRNGYGKFSMNDKYMMAHRMSVELSGRDIPLGLQPDHLCRVRMCVRPDHIEIVTQRINILRGTCPNAVNARKTHCKRGHPLSGANLYIQPSGRRRRCRRCSNMLHAQYDRLRRAKVALAQAAAPAKETK